MLDEKDLQTLLRLKRHEQPPPGYFDDFLKEFQRRQREELLRQPAWQIALERVRAFMGDMTVPRLSYGAAAAAMVMLAGVISWRMLESDPAPQLVAKESAPPVEAKRFATTMPYDQVSFREAVSGDGVWGSATAANGGTRYVIDARPVSYEPPFSF